MKLLSALGGILIATGCGARASPSAREESEDRAPSSGTTLCTPEGDCRAVECASIWRAGPLPTPWWPEGGPADCLAVSVHEAVQAYDDCTPDTSGVTPEQCGAPPAGAIFCDSNGKQSKVTLSCLRPADCPFGFACTVNGVGVDEVPPQYFAGTCEKTCAGTGDRGECVRCDMECDASAGICRFAAERAPEAESCEADCQCAAGPCIAGRCENSLGRGRQALCGSDCRCDGGECRGLCCYRDDGTVVQWREDPMCQ